LSDTVAVSTWVSARVAVMASGPAAEAGPTRTIFTHPQPPYAQALLAAVLPIRTAPMPWQANTAIDTRSGDLVELAPQHWVRSTTAHANPGSAHQPSS